MDPFPEKFSVNFYKKISEIPKKRHGPKSKQKNTILRLTVRLSAPDGVLGSSPTSQMSQIPLAVIITEKKNTSL